MSPPPPLPPGVRVGVLGATSFVGHALLPQLVRAGAQVVAFSRRTDLPEHLGVHWSRLDTPPPAGGPIPLWVCLAPIRVLREHQALLEACGARRVVALSSTSRFTKTDSSDPGEVDLATGLAQSEDALLNWAGLHQAEAVVLRPTLIYGLGRDKNIVEIARFIRRFGFFPLLGAAGGLRQPVHVEDVAAACLAALSAPRAAGNAYNISGADVLPYHEMVGRVFAALGRRPRRVRIPLVLFRLAIAVLRRLPRYRHWTAAMAERMNRDMAFGHAAAARDLGYTPRHFAPGARDLDPG